jgi:NTP pyrophosphatase (non-canonical NTP hydrolase)
MTEEQVNALANLLAREAGMDPSNAAAKIRNVLFAKMHEVEPQPLVYYDTLEQANTARQREWDGGDTLDLCYFGNALAGEVGEACNIIKKLERERLSLKGSRASKSDLAAELADVVIYTSLIAIKSGIELELAIFEKFNATSEKLGFKTRLR